MGSNSAYARANVRASASDTAGRGVLGCCGRSAFGHGRCLQVAVGPLAVFFGAALAACAHPPPPSKAVGKGPPPSDFYVDPESLPLDRAPKLLARLRSSPHDYYRFINQRFAQSVCMAFDAEDLPSVNLHGDAHLEQYAVTDRSRGLTDFDDSATGPPVIDLLRMMTSVILVSEDLGWTAQSTAFLERFLEGYQAALKQPDILGRRPRLVPELRATFTRSRADFLAWTETVTEPFSDEVLPDIQVAIEPYVHRMVESEPKAHDPAFFRVKRAGRVRLGIGSALDTKVLLRVEGPTERADDDVVLEAKQVRDLGGVSCINGSNRVDPFRILIGQSRIAYAPHRLVGYVRYKGETFWIHSWADHYRELDVDTMLAEPEDLLEILFDIGLQLGRGHPNQIASPLDDELRDVLVDFSRGARPSLFAFARRAASRTRVAWERFRRNTKDLVASGSDGS
ncbi:MAG: DUF2252 family protein [Myxococcota bacterium]